jgi:prepilin-type N-terminal cleavage/methylation domain-containing protein
MVKRTRNSGFTLIELLVALAILGVIVVICGRIFEQSNVSWNTGARKAEVNMVGRGIAHFIAQDISRCVVRTKGELDFKPNSVTFNIIDEGSLDNGSVASPIVTITYDLGAVTRKIGDDVFKLAPDGMVENLSVTPGGNIDALGIPDYVDIKLEVNDSEGALTVKFKSRAWLANRDRYRYDD